MDFNEAVAYFYDMPRFTKKHDIAYTKRLLGWLGHPEESFRIVHVAGSNGKGSVCAYLDAIFRQAGIRTGLFTSPHLDTILERFRIDGEMISEKEFLEDFQEMESVLKAHDQTGVDYPTFFEYLFLMAMIRFRKAGVDNVILETGLGGRLDATNACAHPDLCVITSISLEHTDILGDTIEQIAGEKAGIIKPRVPVVYDANETAAADVIKRRADELGSLSIPVVAGDYEIFLNSAGGIDFSYTTKYDNMHLNTYALYQVQNASLAIAAAEQLLRDRSDVTEVIRTGLNRARWSGRMEEALPGIFLDGAHNPSGMQAFIDSADRICTDRRIQTKPLLLFAALKDKNFTEMISMIDRSELFSGVIVTSLRTERTVGAKELSKAFCRIPVTGVYEDAAKAFAAARAARTDGVLFCTGSLYLIGELEKILKDNKTEEA